MTLEEQRDEIAELLTYFRRRELSYDDASAVMGAALLVLIPGEKDRCQFMRALQKAFFELHD